MRIVWSQLFSKPNLMTLPWRAILESMGRMPVAFDPYGMILFTHFISKI